MTGGDGDALAGVVGSDYVTKLHMWRTIDSGHKT
jgi:hypothetical protein